MIMMTDVGTEQLLEYQSYDRETSGIDISGTLRVQNVSASDPVIGRWGGLVNGVFGETLVELNIEAGPSGSLSGGFAFPTLNACEGSLNFVTQIGNTYEFYQDSRFGGGDCSQNARVRLAIPNDGLNQMLEYNLYDPVTDQVSTVGVINRN